MARRKKGRPVHGWLILDKPAGLTSSAAVGRARRALDARKAGHAGTLDPGATGLLAIAFGEATKTVPFVTDARKAYRFTVTWGAETTTDDAAGEITETADSRPSEAEIRAALDAFRGDILQVPPRVSAVKIDGRRAYARTRAGETVEIAPRPLRVERLELAACPDAGSAVLEMTCGKGGYVRSIARDLGRALGCLGHVATLRRLWSGPFTLDGAVTSADLDAPGRLRAALLPVEAALDGLPALDCPPDHATALANGNPVPLPGAQDLAVAWMRSGESRPAAIGAVAGALFRPDRVFVYE